MTGDAGTERAEVLDRSVAPNGPAAGRLPALHVAWLTGQSLELLRFGRGFEHPDGGAAYLGVDGTPDLSAPVHTWITARMAHVYGLAALAGVPGSRPLAQAAFDGLRVRLADGRHGGWLRGIDSSGEPLERGAKSCYDHAFVLLAASTALVAGLEGAGETLDRVVDVMLRRFWDDASGMCVDTWDRAWTELDPYRGVNANMHAVEAFLAVGDALDDAAWYDRAARIASRVITVAAEHDWRIPEHYDAEWQPQLDLNDDNRADQFKPYGATVGHGLEWSRLLVQLAVVRAPVEAQRFVPAAVALFDRAVADGWGVDGREGFVYTTDWSGVPVVRTRMHWVAAEAVGAAWALHDATGDDRFLDLYGAWWDYIARNLVDAEHGSWHHELSERNEPTADVWPGKPDVYHAFQATLIPRLPRRPGLARSVAGGELR
ncbi:AGE family epimerase/isomerase [Cellulomonas alba]|uniref:AGE family epimerase/isomerase n=1 Tax=Cellulomonas alba TaxID=3053467 RepID=A0ABT7SFC0_9CELL|nr:AGE family epimerase/isomerase [Cellulomonas alba]MDM7854734.1 AGE family epimerase/isomerase [Cellulomonas alba]